VARATKIPLEERVKRKQKVAKEIAQVESWTFLADV